MYIFSLRIDYSEQPSDWVFSCVISGFGYRCQRLLPVQAHRSESPVVRRQRCVVIYWESAYLSQAQTLPQLIDGSAGLGCQLHRKRESQHHMSGCRTLRRRLHCWLHPAHRTTAARMAAHRKSDRRRVYLSMGESRKRESCVAHRRESAWTDSR